MKALFIKAAALAAAAVMAACTFALSACAEGVDAKPDNGLPDEGIPDRLTEESEKIVVFAENRMDGFHFADGYSNGQMFNCTWSRESAQPKGDAMGMSVWQKDGTYYGAEFRSYKRYSYGFYSVCMKAADCSGVISSFFTYTGDPRWDEIDIEFLGKDMTEVQFNYYTAGTGGHEFVYDLGFDASEEFHEYAFWWQPDSITWYVDGKAVYRAFEDIPEMPQQIMMNVWNCKGHDEWSGAFDPLKLPATAEYKWVAYVPHDEDAREQGD